MTQKPLRSVFTKITSLLSLRESRGAIKVSAVAMDIISYLLCSFGLKQNCIWSLSFEHQKSRPLTSLNSKKYTPHLALHIMPQEVAFDLYDERWRDCWVAATSTARQRKKQVDMDIQHRVQRLIEDHGPQTDKPLTLRVYGTMIKGFCVINNERARALYFDSERVVLMFARQPFTEDHKIRLPTAKRQRIEAAVTLDLDLARVEACEAFDWTQAPLEQGAFLQLGEKMTEEMLPSMELDLTMMPQLLDPSACEVPQKTDGWLPRFEAKEVNDKVEANGQNDPDCKIVAIEGPKEVNLEDPIVAGIGVDLETLAMEASKRRARAGHFLCPGLVLGFDETATLQTDDMNGETLRARSTTQSYHEMMEEDYQPVDHIGPNLRLLVDPHSSLYQEVGIGMVLSEVPQMQSLLSGGSQNVHEDGPFLAEADMKDASAAEAAAMDSFLGDVVMQTDFLPPFQEQAPNSGVEVQDDRTAEVGDIIRKCLRSEANGVISFDTIMRPGQAERATAALTFAAVLALASAGELAVQQAEPFSSILLAEA